MQNGRGALEIKCPAWAKCVLGGGDEATLLAFELMWHFHANYNFINLSNVK